MRRTTHRPVGGGGRFGSFAGDGAVVAGGAAGQARPTPAGGIFTGGVGGFMAGRAAAASLAGDAGAADGDRGAWVSRVGPEFRRPSPCRGALGRPGSGGPERARARGAPGGAALR